jgi:hypothetical protein
MMRPLDAFRGLLLGVVCGAREIDKDARLIPDNPGIVPRRNYHGTPWCELVLTPIVHDDMHPARDDVPGVGGLATVCPRERLDAL